MFNRDALRLIRERTGLTQAELARRSGVTQGHISLIESGGIVNPTATTIRKLADALEVPESLLVAGAAA